MGEVWLGVTLGNLACVWMGVCVGGKGMGGGDLRQPSPVICKSQEL